MVDVYDFSGYTIGTGDDKITVSKDADRVQISDNDDIILFTPKNAELVARAIMVIAQNMLQAEVK